MVLQGLPSSLLSPLTSHLSPLTSHLYLTSPSPLPHLSLTSPSPLPHLSLDLSPSFAPFLISFKKFSRRCIITTSWDPHFETHLLIYPPCRAVLFDAHMFFLEQHNTVHHSSFLHFFSPSLSPPLFISLLPPSSFLLSTFM